jgi:predicted nucleotidyltransferase
MDRAIRIGDSLAEQFPSLLGICLFGSVARGTAGPRSDIDLLVLTSDPAPTVSQLRQRLPAHLQDVPLSLASHTPESLERYLERWPRFAAHLRREGKVLFDRGGALTSLLAREVPMSTHAELRAQRRHLSNYEEPERFGDRFLFALASLYRIGRAVTFALLAESGVLTFDAERAFDELSELRPERAQDVQAVRRLKPFYDVVTRRGSVSDVPFPPMGCADEVVAAREAVARLIALSPSHDELAA